LNVSAWHYDYSDYVTTVAQFYLNTLTGFPGFFIDVTNAGKAKVDGQSVGLNWALTSTDRVSLNATHLDTEWEDFDVSASQAFALQIGLLPGATPAHFNYEGTPLGMAKDWAGNASYGHIFNAFGGTLDAQVDVNYSGKFLPGNQVSRADVNTYKYVPSVTTGDLSLRYAPPSERWDFTAYVRNVTDETVITSRGYASNAPFLPASDARVLYAYQIEAYGAPRTYGAVFSMRF
jgi:outer membrane receptor protein involved in Fe transport